MKSIFILIAALMLTTAPKSKVIDNFSAGTFKVTVTNTAKKENVQQQDKSILGGRRSVIYKLNENLYEQDFKIQNNGEELIVSQGYGVSGGVSLGYGGINKNQLNLDLTLYNNINIAVSGKAGFARVYFTCWSDGLNRAIWRGRGGDRSHWNGTANSAGHHKPYVIKIPVKDILDVAIEKGGKARFNPKSVDALNFEFLGAQVTGTNYAIDKIWLD